MYQKKLYLTVVCALAVVLSGCTSQLPSLDAPSSELDEQVIQTGEVEQPSDNSQIEPDEENKGVDEQPNSLLNAKTDLPSLEGDLESFTLEEERFE